MMAGDCRVASPLAIFRMNGKTLSTLRHWIPAFAGMTPFAGMTAFVGTTAFVGMTAYVGTTAFAGMAAFAVVSSSSSRPSHATRGASRDPDASDWTGVRISLRSAPLVRNDGFGHGDTASFAGMTAYVGTTAFAGMAAFARDDGRSVAVVPAQPAPAVFRRGAGSPVLLAILFFLLFPPCAEGQTKMDDTNARLQGLEPKLLWEHFLAISRIPRCSRNEQKVRAYVLEVAARNGCSHETDPTGNLVVRKKATPGMENRPVVVLQSHLDMVCEKNKDTVHDFSRDPIRWTREGEWLGADGTTLGADNGIGVAAQLALLDAENVAHGPLELLFTVDEETGLTGASGLAADMLEGRILINLDSEDEDTIFIGCAGGRDTVLSLPLETEAVPEDQKPASIRVGGLQGGHSGLEIDRGRGNAIKILARFLEKDGARLHVRLALVAGGNKRNAIPRESEALVVLPADRLQELKLAAREFERVVKDEFRVQDPGVFIQVTGEGSETPERLLRKDLQARLLDLLVCLHHGVIRMSPDIPGLVQTSTNLAVVATEEEAVTIATSQRSSVASELTTATNAVAAAGRLAGARVHHGEGYPGWKPDPGSPILGLAKEVYPSLFGKEPNVTAIHAGLECGIIGARFPGMDMISFGPTITGAHSPDEKVYTPSVERFWNLLTAMLERVEGDGSSHGP